MKKITRKSAKHLVERKICIIFAAVTYNGQIGQKQIGQIHLFNLLLPNLPIDFIPLPMTLGIAA